MFRTAHLYDRRAIGRLLAISSGLVFALQPLAAQVGLGLSPMRSEIRIRPGAAYTGTMRLVSEGGAIRARASLLDFHLDSEQMPQFQERFPEESAYSCRQWLTLNPMETDIAAGGEMVVRYTIRVPPDAQPRSYYCAAGFTTMPALGAARGIGLQTAVRVIATFYVIVGSPAIEGRLSDITVEREAASKNPRAVVVLENSGEMFFRPAGTVAVLDPEGRVLENYEIMPVPILPERKQRLLFPLKIDEGKPCSLRVRVEMGTGEIQEGTLVVPAGNAP